MAGRSAWRIYTPLDGQATFQENRAVPRITTNTLWGFLKYPGGVSWIPPYGFTERRFLLCSRFASPLESHFSGPIAHLAEPY